MMSSLLPIDKQVKRIEYRGMAVDLIETSAGLVRVGSMPDIAKFMLEHGFREEIVVVPPWKATMAGDNYTGEEFVLWQAQTKGGLTKKYVGKPHDLDCLYNNLNETFAYFFDDARLAIEKKNWINNWFSKHPADPRYTNEALEITLKNDAVTVRDNNHQIYARQVCRPSKDPDIIVEETLRTIPRDNKTRDTLQIQAIGAGNGFTGMVSNCLVRFENNTVWVDPCGYPAQSLAHYSVHWDDITHLLITHNHEDHVQGFSACLKRAEKTANPLKLITAPSIYKILKKQFQALVADFSSLVNLIPLQPGADVQIDGLTITSRWNHHFLPYGTLGLKFVAAGRAFGYSGDTKFDTQINTIIRRKDLDPDWFALCDLVFHEVDFDNPDGVHTHWKQLQKLVRAIPGQVLGYHTPWLNNAPLPLVEQGKIYSFE